MCLVRRFEPSPEVKDMATAYSLQNWQGSLECGKQRYISCLKDALMAVNSEADSSGIVLTSGRHGLVEVDHYSRIEESVRSHK